ncbi:MAG: hypothetical protein GTO30_06010 [Acidobacteria bacterium]|nr:hypothetical protein [Acidobacteriota bacterium]NIO58745.1 hypothetical protein [Acidobacteriota bacterium]NIQ84519.1 hypothetical protein [Acidobacteriota bacterium]
MQSHTSQHPPYDSQRNTVRYSARLLVRFGVQGLERRAPVANISEGGMCVRTNDVYKTGTRILIALELPGGEVHLRGEVMWAIRVPEHQRETMEHGMGVQFLDAGPGWKKAFGDWRREHA